MKWKSSVFQFLKFIIAVFALAGMIIPVGKYISLMQVDSYEDYGVMEFTAVEWYTKTEAVRRQGGVPGHTRYHYFVRYTAVGSDGISYSYEERESSYEKARAAVHSGARTSRRILSDGSHYITISATERKETWLLKSKFRCILTFFGSFTYLAGYLYSERKRKQE